MSNKKATSGLAIWLLVIVAVAGVGGMLYYLFQVAPTQATATPTGGCNMDADCPSGYQCVNAICIVKPSTTGKITYAGLFAYDRVSADANTKVKVPLYLERANGDYSLDGTVSGTSDRTSAETETGETNKAIAFNGTYYGAWKTVSVTGQSPTVDLDVYKIASSTQGEILLYNDQNDVKKNISSITGSSSDDYKRLEMKINKSDVCYNLGGFYFDTQSASNISEINLGGSFTRTTGSSTTQTACVYDTDTCATAPNSGKIIKTGKTIERQKEKDDFVFEIDADSDKTGNQPIMLFEYDTLVINSLVLEADSDGWGINGGTGDWIGIFGFDKAHYRSAVASGGIGFGIENDASTKADVGGADIEAARVPNCDGSICANG